MHGVIRAHSLKCIPSVRQAESCQPQAIKKGLDLGEKNTEKSEASSSPHNIS